MNLPFDHPVSTGIVPDVEIFVRDPLKRQTLDRDKRWKSERMERECLILWGLREGLPAHKIMSVAWKQGLTGTAHSWRSAYNFYKEKLRGET